MSRGISVDLRGCVVAAVDGGASHREAAEPFGVSAASVNRWRDLKLQKGNVRPSPLGSDRNSYKTEVYAGQITTWLGEHKGGILFELRNGSATQGIVNSKSALHRFQVRHEHTQKRLAMR